MAYSSSSPTRSATGQQGNIVGAAAGAVAGALPQGWIRMVDPTTSRPYFVNQVPFKSLSVSYHNESLLQLMFTSTLALLSAHVPQPQDREIF
jgi:hypothetical protein